MFNTARFLLPAFAALFIAACATIPARDPGQGAEEPVEEERGVELIPLEDDGPDIQLDAEDEQRTDPVAAAEENLRRARNATPPFRQAAYLDAADNLIDARRLEDAGLVLDSTDVSGLGPALALRKRLLRAEIQFQRGDLDRAARDAAATLSGGSIDPAYIARALDIQARVDLRQGRPMEAARSWIRRERYLADARALADNHERIWYALGHLDPLALQLAGQDNAGGAGDTIQGWLDLAILFLELGGDRDGLHSAVRRWADANRAHPAADFTTVLLGPSRVPGIRQIGLLLPLSSDYGTPAQYVYSGFNAAHATDTHPRQPQVVFYDIGSEPSLIGNYVGAASVEGADVIVGPLGKTAVNALLESRQPDKPMVLLGTATRARLRTGGGYQFDLAPEPEAARVAAFMYAAGHRRVAALYPDDEWGQRVFEAFESRWEELGGTVAGARGYQPDANDFTAPIKELFKLTASETRQSLLEVQGGLNLHMTPRRRQDIDALFMPSRPAEARLLKPQVDFFQGHDLPVYSTSHVYAGTPDRANDADLDGIRFPGLPWVLRDTTRMNNLKDALRDAGHSNVSTGLFALGYDAYQIALLAADPGLAGNTRLTGLTGELLLGGDGRVQRRFDWAQFNDGVPVRVWHD